VLESTPGYWLCSVLHKLKAILVRGLLLDSGESPTQLAPGFGLIQN
jgi:hypothetical protein